MKRLVLLLSLWFLPVQAAEVLRLDAIIRLQMDDEKFGGFSSIEVSQNGGAFLATSDRGHLLRGDILRQGGRMTGVGNLVLTPILDTKGVPVDGFNLDAERLAVLESGEIYMSFEANHRIMVQDGAGALPEFVPKHPAFRTLINNSGLEALAVDSAGVIYAIPERSGEFGRPFPVYRLMAGAWNTDMEISREGKFLVVGADIFEGQLYVLERALSGLFGFSSRIRRFDIANPTLEGEVLLTTSAGRFDNLEGIALWRSMDGQLRVVLISDDNFKFYQRNQMLELVLETQP